MEPEEVAIREKIRSYASMVEYAPPEPTDTNPGFITFSYNGAKYDRKRRKTEREGKKARKNTHR